MQCCATCALVVTPATLWHPVKCVTVSIINPRLTVTVLALEYVILLLVRAWSACWLPCPTAQWMRAKPNPVGVSDSALLTYSALYKLLWMNERNLIWRHVRMFAKQSGCVYYGVKCTTTELAGITVHHITDLSSIDYTYSLPQYAIYFSCCNWCYWF